MEKPDLDRLWETFIRFSWDDLSSGGYIGLIREKVVYTISVLKAKGDIGWYCFWIHDKNSGVPTSADDDYLYFHIRFTLKKHVNPVDVLPIYCVLTRKVEPEAAKAISIDNKGSKFNVSLLKDESIEEVWRLIGEQSEWLLNLLNNFKDNVNIPVSHIQRFLNHYTDMTALVMSRR
ncbi:hypothetical protein JXA31_08225 [Candidatus Bathyarchaeota archaeon]|nr:hypothetical protein [Candidatus Bathyarchaeota archaeon]